MSEAICKIARETGVVPLDCMFPGGCKHDCDKDMPKPMRLAKTDLTCHSCGAPCRWQEVISAEGKPVPRLFKGGKPHVCKNDATGFESIE